MAKANKMKGKIGRAMKRKLMKHMKGKSASHMQTMVKALSQGKSFTQAHMTASLREKGRQAKLRRKLKKMPRAPGKGSRMDPIDLTGPRYRGKGTRMDPVDLTRKPKRKRRR